MTWPFIVSALAFASIVSAYVIGLTQGYSRAWARRTYQQFITPPREQETTHDHD